MSSKKENLQDDPSLFKDQLAKELEAIEEARRAVHRALHSDKEDLNTLHQTQAKDLLGLAFSGGGIRSATFNLGVIQRLAQKRLLRHIDYLSTVSGGGYIGSWLSSWIHRSEYPNCPGVLVVEEELRAGLENQKEPTEVRWLRSFSNYLTPRVGALSSDTLTAIATYLRNLFLNQSFLIAFGAALIMLPWLLTSVVQTLSESGTKTGLLFAAILLLLGAFQAGRETLLADRGRGVEDPSQPAGNTVKKQSGTHHGYWIIIVLFTVFALLSGTLIPHGVSYLPWKWALLAVLYGIGMLGGWWMAGIRVDMAVDRNRVERLRGLWKKNPWHPIWALIASAVLGGMLLLLGWLASGEVGRFASPMVAVVLGPVFILAALLLTITLHLGLVSRGLREAGREFWSHHGGQQLRLAVGWLVLTGGALFGPLLVMKLSVWILSLGGMTWILTTLAGVLAGSGQKTGGPGSSRTMEFLARIAPYVFIAGLLLALSYGVFRGVWGGLHEQEDLKARPSDSICHELALVARTPRYDLSARIEGKAVAESISGGSAVRGELYDSPPQKECTLAEYSETGAKLVKKHVWYLLFLLTVLCALSIGLSRRIDINVFSLHMFYRNRIERCYMGASNTGRRPHPTTGLDPADSPRLKELVLGRGMAGGQRPFPIVNAALNITSTRNLAWQERKAASFTFTPMYSGYEIEEADGTRIPGYQRTDEYVKDADAWISLGQPITISGAAASPNAGYHTSAATAFLMTVFNVRLGWWLQNPRDGKVWRTPGPKWALFLLLQELIGKTSHEEKYVYLSDGGHFENLGIYELVRRRCRYIIACDAGCDPGYGFEDLGNAVRKCQIDLGVEINIDPHAIRPTGDSGHSTYHCAVGRIRYSEGSTGFLLYIKASLTGDEPADILQYAAQHPDFPHQTTADQWYGESQFESYRKLGFHVMGEVLAGSVGRPKKVTDLEGIFNVLSKHWYRPCPQVASAFAKHGKALEEIFELIRTDEHLHFLDKQIYPEWWYLTKAGREGYTEPMLTLLPEKPEEIRAGFYLCQSLLQAMENVYLDLNLEEQYKHPDNRGWMNLFRHWSWSGMFRVTWAVSASMYGARFQRFCERRLGLDLVAQVICGEAIASKDLETNEQHRLNFEEKRHANAVISCIDNSDNHLSIVELSLEVINPFGDSNKINFPFAFAILEKQQSDKSRTYLVYYRVRDHLRGMGLGRKGLSSLYRKHRLEAKLKDLKGKEDCIKNEIIEFNPSVLDRLWCSVVRTE